MLKHLPAGVVVHSPDSRILSANAAALRMIGQEPSRLLGLPAVMETWKFLREDGSVMPLEEYPVMRTLETLTPHTDLVVGVRRSGEREIYWALCNTCPVFDSAGVLQEVVVCFTSISAWKHAELDLRDSEERLRLVLLGSTDASWDWDVRQGRLYYSPRWWQMVGRDPDAHAGDEGYWRRLLHPDDVEAVDTLLLELNDGLRQSYEIEFRLRHRLGHYVPMLSRGFATRDADGKLVRLSGTNMDLTERKASEQRIHRLANYDDLTGLPNRRLLMAQLHAALRTSLITGQHGALLFIDLDHFKTLNDTLGHLAGDQLLQQVAQRLSAIFPGIDQVSRLGGDEFIVVLPNLGASREQAGAAAEAAGRRLLDALREPFALTLRRYRSTPSIGITFFEPGTGDVETLLKQGDLAMYQAKTEGRDTLRYFDPGMQAAINSRVTMEEDLHQGLLQGQFHLHYQTQVDARNQLKGVELLLRWQHPERGLLCPGEFITIAEATGLIIPIGRWVLREACQQIVRWSGHPVLGQITVAINVSAEQLAEEGFVDDVLAALRDTGATPGRLVLELTESMLVENIESAIEKMHRLRAAGCSLSLDDFGTGYSSLNYLKRFPLRQLKIDQSFVRDLEQDPAAHAICEIIIMLAKKLQLRVIAEGVETPDQFRNLRTLGCETFQGYLFSRPQPLEQMQSSPHADRGDVRGVEDAYPD
jgi:diguanylate cyclase (GGDEF)-like protein/PAS domain S-box-containing protein